MDEILVIDPIEAEVDAIRQRIYERTKNMTIEERKDYLIRRTDPIIKQFNIKMSKLKPVKFIRCPIEVEEDDL